MKITYTAPNRAHHYPYAEALHRAGHLHAFVSGFSRFSPRAALPSVNDRLQRHDFFQNLYLASLHLNAPAGISGVLNRFSNRRLDQASYKWAAGSDVFLYYRTQGRHTAQRLRRQQKPTLCVLEEVNSHVQHFDELMQEECRKLNLLRGGEKACDHAERLLAYEEADAILCPSEFVRRSFLQKGFAAEKLIKVNFGFPPLMPSPQVKKRRGSFKVLFVGQLHYRKGLRYAVDAFGRLNAKNKEMVIVGPKTPVTGLENRPLPAGLQFTGPLKGAALEEQYKTADVFVLPSLEEGLALVQGEALSFGLPLLITTHTGGADLIRDGREGYIVPPANALALADRLQQMYDDRPALAQMSVAAYQAAERLGSWDAAAGKLVAALTEKLAAKRANL